MKDSNQITKEGGTAFPDSSFYGMTLRDYFAGHALAGMLADPNITGNLKLTAEVAYNYADAMLKERMKK